MQAVLPVGAIVLVSIGVVLMALALDSPEIEKDHGSVTMTHEFTPDGTRLVVTETKGLPVWLDMDAHTMDGMPVPHRYEGHDEAVDPGEALVLTGNGDRHLGATITLHGRTVYTIPVLAEETDPGGV